MQEIVQASGELGVVGDLGSDLGAHISLVVMNLPRLGALLAWTLPARDVRRSWVTTRFVAHSAAASPLVWGWRGRCSGTARGSGRNCAAKRGLAGRR